jgi:hypothetical protein
VTESITRSMPLAPPRPPAAYAPAAARPEADYIIRPAAIIPMGVARALLDWLALNSLEAGGLWSVGETTGIWQRYDKPWNGPYGARGESQLVGTVFVTYDKPRKHDVVLHRVQITDHGLMLGWTTTTLVDELLGKVGLTIDTCPRDTSMPTTGPKADPFRRPDAYDRGVV